MVVPYPEKEYKKRVRKHGTGDDSAVFQCRKATVLRNDKKKQITLKPVSDRTVILNMKDYSDEEFEMWYAGLQRASAVKQVRLSDFEVLSKLGKGGCGRVYKARLRSTGEIFAIKVLEKSSMGRKFRPQHIIDERHILEITENHPFLLKLFYAFQTSSKLYLVTEYCPGGDMYKHLRMVGRAFEEKKAKRIIAEVILGLEHLHKCGAIYRDLKLENIFLDAEGHIRLADFGLSKVLRSNAKNRMLSGARSFCGTKEYIAPEMIKERCDYGQAVDFWALGVVLYELVTGRNPFYCKKENEMFQRINRGEVYLPPILSDDLQAFLLDLLCTDPARRIGVNGYTELKNHPWLSNVDWHGIYIKEKHRDSIRMSTPEASGTEIEDEDIKFSEDRTGRAMVLLLERLSKPRVMSVAGYSFCGTPDSIVSHSGYESPRYGIFDSEEKSPRHGTFDLEEDDLVLPMSLKQFPQKFLSV